MLDSMYVILASFRQLAVKSTVRQYVFYDFNLLWIVTLFIIDPCHYLLTFVKILWGLYYIINIIIIFFPWIEIPLYLNFDAISYT